MALLLSSFVGSGGAAATGNIVDNREFKNWQDFVGDCSGNGVQIPQATRVVNGQSVNRQGGSHTFTVPDGVTKVRITCIGGGGGGGCYHSTYYGGAGGGGGCFASGEYNVTPGQTLSVTAGTGGGGSRSQGYGSAGGSSSVTDSSTGGTLVAVSAAGGSAGQYTSTSGSGGSSHSAGGSSVISGSTVGGHGGNGGYGSSNAFGFGPEGYGAGGGGSAGSFLGSGGTGGHGTNGGYTYSSGGGGGIGGQGGQGYGSNSTSAPNQYQDHAGAGGGSGGTGQNGTYNNATYRSQGGSGRVSSPNYVGDYREQYSFNKVAGQISLSYANDSWMRDGRGARYGDGTTLEPLPFSLSGGGTGGQSGVLSDYDQDIEGVVEATDVEVVEYVGMSRTLPEKMFNGILGRLWGGGGGGAPCHDTNFGYYNHTGGEGGSGAGGGGGSGATTSWNVSDNQEMRLTSFWDYANMAFRVDESNYNVNSYRLMGHGGHGGALGGGGGSATYAYGGSGGIGGGGGGGGGHYSGGSYPSYAGHGGPGYVLIEW